MLGRYRAAVEELVQRLSVSASIAVPDERLLASLEEDRERLPEVWETNRQRNSDEPLRLKLSYMAARLERGRLLVASRDAQRPVQEPAAYGSAGEFEADLQLVRQALLDAGARDACRTSVDPLVASVRAHGFHGFMLDIRDHAEVHTAALEDMAAKLGLDAFDADALKRELLGRRPLTGEALVLEQTTLRVLDTVRTMRLVQDEIGEEAACTYVVSMTTSPEDLLRVLLLAREAGLVDLTADPPMSRLDVVPLFETLDDLQRAPAVMRTLLQDDVYRRQLEARGMRQEVMVGYSDSSKDAGILASSWALHGAQESLAKLFANEDVQLTLFHGRGGSVGRGGGSPVYRALAALPPKTVQGRIKITEQGEIISQQFGLPPVAERTMEVTLAGVLLQEFEDWRRETDPDVVARCREVMTRLAESSVAIYRSLVHEDDSLFEFFRQASPVAALANARFGSRPAYRPGSTPGVEGIRAIPWGFGWTQMRLMLPGWLGVGSALQEVIGEPDGLATLQGMARDWPFFDDLLAKIEMVCAKADLDIARMYAREAGADMELFARLEQEYRQTVECILRIRQAEHLLDDTPVLQSAIALRNPYVDPLSLLQVVLLRRTREAGTSGDAADDDAGTAAGAALATTLSGIAQGLRNTG